MVMAQLDPSLRHMNKYTVEEDSCSVCSLHTM